MNVGEHVPYPSFLAENALPMGDCMMSMPLSKTYLEQSNSHGAAHKYYRVVGKPESLEGNALLMRFG
jgi:hypothetical protein